MKCSQRPRLFSLKRKKSEETASFRRTLQTIFFPYDTISIKIDILLRLELELVLCPIGG